MKEKIVKKRIGGLLDTCIILGNSIMILFMVAVVLASVNVWVDAIKSVITVKAGLFWSGLLIAIVSGCMGFIQHFINGLVESFRRIKNE